MLRKYALIASVLAVLGTPSVAKAQTTLDISMKIQAILDQFSEIRSGLKQIQSSMNIETMLNNLKGDGGWKAMLKNAKGGIFDKNAGRGGTKQSLLALPDGLAEKTDDVKASKDWVQKNLVLQNKNASVQEINEMVDKRTEFRYAALASGYGKAVALRKQLDKDIMTIEKLRQEAESKEAETDLQNEINKLALLKLEQANYQQMFMATNAQIEESVNLSAETAASEENAESEKEENKQEQADKADKTKSKLEEQADKVKGKLDEAKDKVKEQTDKVKGKLDEAKDKVKEQTDKVKGKVEEQAGKAKEKATEAVKQAFATDAGGKSAESNGENGGEQ